MKPQNMSRLEKLVFKLGFTAAVIVMWRYWIGAGLAVWLAFHYLG